MRKRTLAREFALQILYQMEMSGSTAEESMESFWEHQAPPEKDVRSFTEILVRGVAENVEEIDRIIIKATENWQIHRMAAVDRNIMRFATYELLYMSDIPPKVSINEAVNIAKKFSQTESGKFVNGVLDKINHSEKVRDGSDSPEDVS